MRAAASPARIEIVRDSRPRPRKAEAAEVLDERHTRVSYSAGRSMHYLGPNRILPNPDQIIAKVGGYLDVAFYEDMLLRHPWLAGIVDQRVEKANKQRVIVPGDPSVPRSVMLADAARRKWKRVQGSVTALGRGLRNGRFIGPGGLEKVFDRDGDGLVFASRLIPRPPQSIRFRDDGTALWLADGSFYAGEEIPARKMMFIRGGSQETPYPDVELKNVYAATVVIEKAWELMLDNIEEFGRPIPILYMPRAAAAMQPGERQKARAAARAIHSRFIEFPTDATRATIEMAGNSSLAASGQVGRPELAIIEAMVTYCYIRILRIAQTMNKTGSANGMLEEVRYQITDDASRPDCLLLDDSLNAEPTAGVDPYPGWMTDFNDFNFPDDPEEILPRFETPVLSQEEIERIHKRTMEAVDRDLGNDLSKDSYLRTTGLEKAKNADDRLGGKPLTRLVEGRVDSADARNAADSPAEPLDDEPSTLAALAAHANKLSRDLDAMIGIAERE